MAAVIVAPSQGEHASLFQTVAKSLLSKVYGGQGWIFKTIVHSGGNVAVHLISKPQKGDIITFWSQIEAAKSFITVSHCGAIDGPILARQDPDLTTTDEMQPWHLEVTQRELAERGQRFWGRVGKHLPEGGKIMILGCASGNTYAPIVARKAQRRTFGFLDSCAAADSATMVRIVTSIETRGSAVRVEGFGP